MRESHNEKKIGNIKPRSIYSPMETSIEKTEAAYRIVRDRVFSGAYWPRQRLIEADLAENLGIQRFQVREILKRLVSEQLLVSERYKGCIIAEISIEEASQIYEVQAFLEGSAALLSVPRINSEEINHLEQLIDASKKLDEHCADEWVKLNREIHRTLNKSCGNKKLLELIKSNVKFMKYWFIAISTRADITKRNAEHDLIVKALKLKDPEEVRRTVENHIREAGKDMQKRLRNVLPEVKKYNI